MKVDYFYSEFVTTKAGEPFRLLPFGPLYKGGVKHEVTPALAAQFKLPHFLAPIKLGSHREETPAGGHIVALEVRGDGNCALCVKGECGEHGLFAVPEWNEKGIEALETGAYRGQSPEIMWENGAFEDPKTGKMLKGPMITGDALLHNPHLGKAAALYSADEAGKDDEMSESYEVPKGLWDRFNAWLDKLTTEPEPKTEPPAPTQTPDQLAAVITERDQIKAQLDQLNAEKQQAEAARVLAETKAGIVTTLQNQEQYGASWIELAKAQEAADILSSMGEEQRSWVMRQFGALAMQIKESALVGELGSNGQGVSDPRMALDTAIKAKAAEKNISYLEAQVLLAGEKPELFK